jgi:S-adenosylmethionine decarboxylase
LNSLATHILVELYEGDPECLDNAGLIETEMVKAAEMINATIISSHAHNFEPHGVSAVVIIAESHLTMHTWPEHCYAAVDLFICTKKKDPAIAFNHLQRILKAKRISVTEINRGVIQSNSSNTSQQKSI